MSTPDTASDGTLRFATCGDASALHATLPNGINLVGIGNIRVLVRREHENMWIAQGLEIDYCAEGGSKDEAKEAFAQGLELTIRENIRMFSSLDGVLKTAPADVWQEFFACATQEQLVHTQMSVVTSVGTLPVDVYAKAA